MKTRLDLLQHLRDRILGELHVGRLRAGDRLPSIRHTATLLGKNPRTVAAAYDVLEAEGLVEVRGRSGVYVARQEMLGEGAVQELARWMGSVVAEGWKRRLFVATLSDLVRRCTRSVTVRCGFVELIEDAIVAYRHELVNEWGLDVRIISPESLNESIARHADVDFFVCTSFYAPLVHHAAQQLNKPLVVLTVHARLQEAIQEQLRQEGLIVIVADARFETRIRVAYAENYEQGKIRVLLADDHEAIEQLDPARMVLLTRAARNRMDEVRLTNIMPYSPTISAVTASTLAEIIVRLNLEGEHGRKASSSSSTQRKS